MGSIDVLSPESCEFSDLASNRNLSVVVSSLREPVPRDETDVNEDNIGDELASSTTD